LRYQQLMSDLSAPLTLKDIAREAGVSLATVDRVLHERPGVRTATVQRVKEAIERHAFRPHAAAVELARRTPIRFALVMPEGPNLFMDEILSHLADMGSWLKARRTSVETIKTNVFDPDTLATTLDQLAGRYRGLAVVALDHPLVHAAIDNLEEDGTHVVTLVSDVPASRRQRYVGIDKVAAGRTAGSLVGRLVGAAQHGKVGVIAGSQALRDHAERIFGFTQVLTAQFPQCEVLPTVEGRDEDHLSYSLTARLLAEHHDLIGLYNVGAGTPGVARAVMEAGREKEVVFVGHDLTSYTRRFLLSGVMDAVISQNPGHEARSAIRVLLSLARGEPILAEQEKIRIDIVMRDNLP
jgi:LacI family transcriptional regulator